ncbi:MAG: hypothetical protein A3K10_00385 [Bacteroidetes bacterium RIFCSPLOWO2_12_FULL_31_6]|nr:MAG: hypothetical protein A3K10_00385 [Bacteroidetes bacterium RIFCSPLOWO2_12_FULL_31_6]
MENQEKKQTVALRGNIGKDVEIGKIPTKNGEKEIANFSIAIKEGDKTNWINCEAWEKNIDKVRNLKKGDFVELSGVHKEEYTTKKGDTKKDFSVYEATQLNKTIKGNIGADVTVKTVAPGKDVANFSVAVKEGETSKWVNCQAWGANIDKVRDLKKGDFVELKGALGKEYGEEKKRDLIVTESHTLKVSEAHSKGTTMSEQEKPKTETKVSAADKALIDGVAKGDTKAVGAALKNGGNPEILKKDHFKGLTEKSEKAITNMIDKFKISGDVSEPKKKGMKI